MKARYHLPTNTLEQLPEKKKPICINGISPNLCSSIRKNSNMKECECLIYNAHIASLRKDIPCDPSCREIWTDKGEYEHLEHFVFILEYGEEGNKAVAVPRPLSAPVEQDQAALWKLAFGIMDKDFKGERYDQECIAELKKHFILTKIPTP